MGHSSKKNKRSSGNRKGKEKAPSKDHPSHANDDPDLLSEDITSLSVIFQEEVTKLVSDSLVIQVKSRDDNSPTLANSLSAGCGDPQNHQFQNPKPILMLDFKGGSVLQLVTKLNVEQDLKANADSGEEKTSSRQTSRYLNNFEEISSLDKIHTKCDFISMCIVLREVATLSRLQHQHVVRYYQAWFETEVGGYAETTWGSLTAGSYSCSYKGDTTVNLTGPDNKLESTYLYIQMEYYPR
ncbi:hypothetical protein ACLOJK_009013 [Asimina triloba]